MIAHSAPTLGPEEEAAVARVLRSGRVAQGPEVEAFERECAEACGRRFGVAVSSGTAALQLALGAVGTPAGGRVAIPSYACAALATAVGLHGATPVLCDNAPGYNLDPGGVPGDCYAVIVPHLFGEAAALPDHARVVEDIAQSMGGETGRRGVVAIASFYATKLMTTGEGGMVLADDPALAGFIRDQRDYDNRPEFALRHNYKMTDMQAAIGRVQLRRLPEFIARRRAIAAAYTDGFQGLPLDLPAAAGHVFFRYVVATEHREALAAHLAGCGIDAKRPVFRPAHHYFGGDYPGAEQAHRRALSLPIYPSLVEEDVRHVLESARRFFD